jgi:hypothetical protein
VEEDNDDDEEDPDDDPEPNPEPSILDVPLAIAPQGQPVKVPMKSKT